MSKPDLVVCGSTRHDLRGCKELHVPARDGDECPICRKKTRDEWRRQKALDDAEKETPPKTFKATG